MKVTTDKEEDVYGGAKRTQTITLTKISLRLFIFPPYEMKQC